jgi:signal peptidase I
VRGDDALVGEYLGGPMVQEFESAAPRRKKRAFPLTTSLMVFGAIAGGLLLGTLILRIFVFEPYRQASGSMLPTYAVGRHFIANKLSRTPRRGDVVVFRFPEKPDQEFLKRVVALGGDSLEVRGGHPVLNGWTVPSCRIGPWSYKDSDSPMSDHDGDVYVEYLGDAAYLTFYDKAAGLFPEDQGPYLAKAGEFWVMGDNRNNSHDSRMWFGGQGGGVPMDLLIGRVVGSGDPPSLPSSMGDLADGLAKCLASRPSGTTPPPPRR